MVGFVLDTTSGTDTTPMKLIGSLLHGINTNSTSLTWTNKVLKTLDYFQSGYVHI